MQEACYCGRIGEIEDREPARDEHGEEALACPDCGAMDYLRWLSQEARTMVLKEAERRQLARHGRPEPGHAEELIA